MFMRLGFNFYDVAVTIFCVAFGLLCFYPLWYCLVASVMPYEEYVKGGLMLWFKGIDLQYYIQIFSTKVYTNSLLVSAVKTVLATALSVLVTSAMAYAVSKVHIRGMKLINALVVFNLFFTGGLIPQYMLYKSLHLTGNFWVMVLPGTLNISYFIIMRNYFSFSVSRELEDAAMIDGCNEVGIFFRIVMPLSRGMIAAVTLFIAVINWNDYYSYMMFIGNKTKLQPFAWVLHRMLTDKSLMNQVRNGAASLGFTLPPPMALRMATIICATLPHYHHLPVYPAVLHAGHDARRREGMILKLPAREPRGFIKTKEDHNEKSTPPCSACFWRWSWSWPASPAAPSSPRSRTPPTPRSLRRQLTPPLRIPPRLNPPTRAKRSTSALPSSATTSTISTAMPTTPSRPPSSRPSA